MGLFGGGNSKSTTVNEDNRIINDYGGSTFDYSQEIDNSQEIDSSQEIDNSITGDMAGNRGIINVVDGNAIDSTFALADQVLSFTDKTMSDSLGFADSAINANAALVGQYGDLSGLMMDRSISGVESAYANAGLLLDNQADRNLSAALTMTEATVYQSQLNNDFARDLFAQNGEAALDQQMYNSDALGNGFKSMMQFADSVSRSDGANLAESNNKTVMVVSSAVVIGFVVYQIWGK